MGKPDDQSPAIDAGAARALAQIKSLHAAGSVTDAAGTSPLASNAESMRPSIADVAPAARDTGRP